MDPTSQPDLPESNAPTQPFTPPPAGETPPTPSGQGGRIGLTIGIVVLLVALIGGGLYLAINRGSSTSTATVTATATPSPSPTTPAGPTAIPTQTVPSPATGFTTYTALSKVWGINYPSSATITPGVQTVQGFPIPDTTFTLDKTTTLQIFESPIAIPDSQLQQLLAQLPTASGVQNVQIVEQLAPVKLGQNTWQRITLTGSLTGAPLTTNGTPVATPGTGVPAAGTPVEVTALYAPQNAGGIVVLFTTSPDTYTTARDTYFTPMMQSFALLK